MNAILNWSHDKPAEPGLYLYNRGDVETEANTGFFRLGERDGELAFVDKNGYVITAVAPLKNWHSKFKFARLCVGAEAEDVV